MQMYSTASLGLHLRRWVLRLNAQGRAHFVALAWLQLSAIINFQEALAMNNGQCIYLFCNITFSNYVICAMLFFIASKSSISFFSWP